MDPQNLGARNLTRELYDLSDDPHDLQNLVANAKHAQQQCRLLAALRDWVEETKDRAVKP